MRVLASISSEKQEVRPPTARVEVRKEIVGAGGLKTVGSVWKRESFQGVGERVTYL